MLRVVRGRIGENLKACQGCCVTFFETNIRLVGERPTTEIGRETEAFTNARLTFSVLKHVLALGSFCGAPPTH